MAGYVDKWRFSGGMTLKKTGTRCVTWEKLSKRDGIVNRMAE